MILDRRSTLFSEWTIHLIDCVYNVQGGERNNSPPPPRQTDPLHRRVRIDDPSVVYPLARSILFIEGI